MFKRFILFLQKQYTSIGGQAVIEGVMMRSPHSFVVAVRKPDGKIRIRQDQWFGLGEKFDFLKKPFMRGVLILIETMANGIVSLNYSANIAQADEIREKERKKGKSEEEIDATLKKKEEVNFSTFITIFSSFLLGIGLFVFVPHTLTAWLAQIFDVTWDLDSFEFHAIDGLIKGAIFILYIFLIGFIPDIRRVFQYHGAEHKSISTFEAGQELKVENAKKFTTLHPRCGTSFVFFLLLISIIFFSAIFTLVPVGGDLPVILKHLVAIVFKIFLMLPIAGVSYELIKYAGKCSDSAWSKLISYPGMMLQKLTTREPDDDQLEVALSSIKVALYLEKNHELNKAKEKILTLEEKDIDSINDIESTNATLSEFAE
jgi:uncharacterized protein YqhQ